VRSVALWDPVSVVNLSRILLEPEPIEISLSERNESVERDEHRTVLHVGLLDPEHPVSLAVGDDPDHH